MASLIVKSIGKLELGVSEYGSFQSTGSRTCAETLHQAHFWDRKVSILHSVFS